jgi:hypothetical protein
MEIEKNVMTQQMQQVNYNTYEPQSEIFHLPSKGLFYPPINENGDRLTSVKVYDLVTEDENILLNPALFESGEMIDVLLKRKVQTPYPIEKFTTGDRLSIFIYLRSTMERMYRISVMDPKTNIPFDYEVDLLALELKESVALPGQDGLFEYKLPKSERIVKFRLSTGEDEIAIRNKNKKEQELRKNAEPFNRILKLEQQIVSIEGITDVFEKRNFIKNMQIGDSRKLVKFMDECMPILNFNIEVSAPSGGTFRADIPITAEFFFPDL